VPAVPRWCRLAAEPRQQDGAALPADMPASGADKDADDADSGERSEKSLPLQRVINSERMF